MPDNNYRKMEVMGTLLNGFKFPIKKVIMAKYNYIIGKHNEYK
jgi:hypothetical protein